MKLVKLTLHNGSNILVNMDRVLHSMATQDDETGNEYTRLMLDASKAEMQQVDVSETLDDILKLIKGK